MTGKRSCSSLIPLLTCLSLQLRFLGGVDSCQGDSGGPLWRNIDKDGDVRATQIGVVSRGKGCAGFNDPAIFGSVKKIYKWIRRTVKKHKTDKNLCIA